MKHIHLQVLRKLKYDFEYYSPRCLQIIDKQSGQLVPFKLNKAQRYINRKLDEQIAKIGKVRAVIVKGRQQGSSTLVEGRYFHKATLFPGTSVFILAHISSSTDHLFGMAKRYYENAPTPILPPIDKMNERRLEFNAINSSYSVGTAGSAQIGRGTTVRLFHGSECAYWDHTADIAAGVLQAVPDADGTEIIFESTANGPGDWFHSMALAGLDPESDGDFITIFVPWFWQDEYFREPPPNFTLTPEEEEIAHMHKLSTGQMCWRRKVIQDTFSGDETRFMREYPNTVHEAFTASGDSLIKPALVMAARKSNIHSPLAPVIGGCDPAREGDRTVMVLRRGREIYKWYKYQTMDEMTCAGLIAEQIDKFNITKYFIDTGCGYGTVDRLRELGYGDIVTPVHFGSGAMQSDIFVNKRAEMADALREWFDDGAVNIPDNDEIHADLTAVPPHKKQGSRARMILMPKDDIKTLFGKSTDIFDACFIKNTKITVPGGHRNIQDLQVGDKVYTPFGARTITKLHKLKAKKLTEVLFSNGKKLVGTPNHKVFSFKGGLIPLDVLSLTNEVETDSITRRVLWKLNKWLFMGEESISFKAQASTIAAKEHVSRKDFCTGEFITTTMGQYPKGCTYTTKMGIGKTIVQTIWKWWSVKPITRSIWKNFFPTLSTASATNNTLKTSGLLLQNGIGQRQGVSGTASMEKGLGLGESQKSAHAKSVEESSCPWPLKSVCSVLNLVARNKAIKSIKQKLESAWSVVKTLFLTSTGLKSVVPENVQTYAGGDKFVYNMTLDFDNMYYANGILVENCMLTFAFPVSPKAAQQKIKRVGMDTSRPQSPLATVRDFNRGPKNESNNVTTTFKMG